MFIQPNLKENSVIYKLQKCPTELELDIFLFSNAILGDILAAVACLNELP
jgi:hypothetical protein